MAENKNRTLPFRLVIRRSSPLMKIVVLAAVVLSIAALLALRSAILDTRAQAEALRSQAASLEQENEELTEKVDGIGTVDGILQIAQEELGLVDPDTVVIKPEQ